jgi:putative chitinase
MIPMTIPGLLSVMPRAAPFAAQYAGLINTTLVAYNIVDRHEVCNFLASMAYESNELTQLEENLNYTTPARLVQVFPSRFAPGLAQACAGRPEDIANVAYCGRLGNGPLGSGDGWRYRGRGIFQLTGRANYEECERDTGIKCVASPELLTVPTYAVESACWFWVSRGLGKAKDFREVTRMLNGPAMEGLEGRVAYLKRAEALALR